MSELQLVNRMETVVKYIIKSYLQEHPEICSCERCFLDMIALTLNSLPPKYVVTTLGDVVTTVDLYGTQSTADIMIAFMKALDVVRKKPRH